MVVRRHSFRRGRPLRARTVVSLCRSAASSLPQEPFFLVISVKLPDKISEIARQFHWFCSAISLTFHVRTFLPTAGSSRLANRKQLDGRQEAVCGNSRQHFLCAFRACLCIKNASLCIQKLKIRVFGKKKVNRFFFLRTFVTLHQNCSILTLKSW